MDRVHWPRHQRRDRPFGGYATYLVFRTKTEAGLASQAEKIAETNTRVSDLAKGVATTQTEVREFKYHVERHFVEKDEIADLKGSFDRSIDRMQQSIDAAVGTMGDVRDAVMIMTAKPAEPPKLPPSRRPSRAKTGA